MTKALFRTLALAAVMAIPAAGAVALTTTEARAETRTLDLYFTHTKQRKKITFKRNGKYVKSGLRKINRILRDHRRKEATRMDPKLFDLVWEIYKEAKGRKPIHVISGYRSPKTNAALRRRGRKTARKSQHMRGKALDWFIPGVSVAKLHKIAMRRHGGGVGHYRNSFIHTDTARVRHWPRMSRRQLARIFPRGRTIHVPSNGKPLRGYKVAMANLKKGLRADGRRPRYKSDGSSKTLLASIFRKDDDKDEEEAAAEAKARLKVPARKPAEEPARKETLVADKGTDLFAADAEKARDARAEAAKPVRIARAIVPASRPGSNLAVQQPATLVAAVDPARPANLPTADLAGTRPALESFSVAELKRRRANGTAPTQAIAYARPDVEVPGEAAVEALAAGRATVAAPVEPTATTELAMAEPMVAPQRNIEALNARIRSSFAARPATPLARPERTSVSDALAGIRPAPLRRPAAPKIDEAIVTAALARSRKDAPVRSVVEPAKRSLTASRKLIRQRTGDVTFVRLSNEARPVAFAIGNLYGRSVKTWATARTTRRGLFATLRAPDYRQSTRLPSPDAVYAIGFRKQPRQRTDSFTGTSLLKVRYRELAQLTR